ncbi:MAG: histidinol phosphate phosphatase [Armatimonadetes bacterium]|nr:histidinol phosphate phosphatase [Armatimonadota bacterium]
MSTVNLDLQELLEFALDAVWEAGRVTLGFYQTSVEAERKADNTPVTEADRQAEERLRQLIGRRYPEHRVLGEELGGAPGEGLTWVIDPIDGTKSFICGVPLYANLLALLLDREPVLGILHFPALQETVYAARGLGCYWNGRRARVSGITDLKNARVLTSGVEGGSRVDRWRDLARRCYFARTWGDAYGYALVATGRAEIMVDPALELWDAAPLQVVMEEAGGTFTDWTGRPTVWAGEGIATNGKLLDETLQSLSTS